MNQEEYLKKLYSNRFDPHQRKAKIALWKTLTDEFLQKYIDPESVVLDIGGGYCEFINQVKAREKYLIDLNPDSQLFADPNVTIFNVNVLNIQEPKVLKKQYDIIFVSNFFEHLNSKEDLIKVLLFCFNHLNPGGSLLIIQPNFKYSVKEYYDFIDHQLPITHLSLKEVLEAIGFKIKVLIPKFLPYSTKGRPSSPKLLSLYLKLPFAWQFLGGQMFIQASKQF
ncbi:class I SAM-dependent methyltransferase [Floridanema aerugineum]|uniref:Class I SAM-dependent methyltransferase n=1 Tax=Floridaenema aerugineum BLCC-F46 TaxID=3153654 RepID=A0ABV4XEP2_9CYAN